MNKVERLRKLLVLAMSTENENESRQALRAIRRWMAATGKGAEWVLDNVGVPPPPFVFAQPAIVPWSEQVIYLSEAESIVLLNDREMRFVADMLTKHGRGDTLITLRQARWLGSIYNRHVLARGVVNAQQTRT